jgi:hypothetical protein
MYLNHSYKVHIATCILMLFILLSNIRIIQSLPFVPDSFHRNTVTTYESRFSEIKKYLSNDETVGYLPEKHVAIQQTGGDGLKDFYLTQYAIIPTKLTNSIKPRLVIANFSSSTIDSTYLKEKKLVIEKDFGHGVLLLRHR